MVKFAFLSLVTISLIYLTAAQTRQRQSRLEVLRPQTQTVENEGDTIGGGGTVVETGDKKEVQQPPQRRRHGYRQRQDRIQSESRDLVDEQTKSAQRRLNYRRRLREHGPAVPVAASQSPSPSSGSSEVAAAAGDTQQQRQPQQFSSTRRRLASRQRENKEDAEKSQSQDSTAEDEQQRQFRQRRPVNGRRHEAAPAETPADDSA